MAKFALVDHGLESPIGHNLIYAQRVAGAARAVGLVPVIGCAAGARFEGLEAAAFRCFSRNPWRNNPAEDRNWQFGQWIRSLRRRAARLKAPAGPRRPAVAMAPERRQPLMGRLTATGAGLVDDARALATAWDLPRRFADELEHFLARTELAAGDIVFLPNAKATEVAAVSRLIAGSSQARALRWRILLRYPLSSLRSARNMGDRVRELGRQDADVSFFGDTPQLCAYYAALSGLTVTQVPAPATPPGGRPAKDGVLTCAVLGDARIEKGFLLLPEIIAAAGRMGSGRRPLRFVVQCNPNLPGGEPGVETARAALAARAGADLALIDTPLSSEQYLSQMAEADLVLLPYAPEAYSLRSSGVFAEAVAAGTPVIVSEGTSMAALLRAADPGAARRLVCPHRAQAYAEAIVRAADSFDELKRSAGELRDRLRSSYDPAALIRLLSE